MQLEKFFKSVLDQDKAAVVLCDVEHTIIYMNPSAIQRYEKRGGAQLLGKSLMECHAKESREKIEQNLQWFRESATNNIVFEFYNETENKDVYMVALRDGEQLIGYYEKHEYRNAEKNRVLNPTG